MIPGMKVFAPAAGTQTSLAVIVALLIGSPSPAQTWSVASPDQAARLSVTLADGRLSYRVDQGGVEVIRPSPLGLRLAGADLASGLTLREASAPRIVEEKYVLASGKRTHCVNRGRHQTLAFDNAQEQPLELDLRAFNDGVAFRYRLPGSNPGTLEVERELTGFAPARDARFWAAPADKVTTYSPAYETYYQLEQPLSAVAAHGLGWSFPLLFRTADSSRWALLTEAGLQTNYCATRLSSAATNGVFTIEFPDSAEGNGLGRSAPQSTLPWETPWRVVILGSSLATVVESTLVTDLSPPSMLADASWVKPGRVAWSWWSDPPSPRSAARQKQFIDLAAQMGWEYALVDANWTIMTNGNVQEVLSYAKAKGVGILLWYNSGGPHNYVTEKPRDTLTYAPVREFELKLLREWGVKGIKVDFFQSDKQDIIGLYHGILRDAARHQVMINFHGCTLPRGWQRQYPHLLSMEAVRGAECYIFDPKYPEAAPVQNTVLPFTRNAVGPMDFTPVTFSDNRYPRQTTSAHELALAVVFESGWLHFADQPDAYLQLPDAPRQFLKQVPAAWDETRLVDGYPGRYVILARRKGTTWYLAGINGENKLREAIIPPTEWLGTGQLQIIADGSTPRTFHTRSRTFASADPVRIPMLPRGGFVGVLSR